jgi:ankyrin repeat protein
MVTYLVETLQVPINQQALNGLWTPLHRCARLIHYKHAHFFDIFEFLLKHGADPKLLTADDDEDCPPCTAFDLVVKKVRRIDSDVVRFFSDSYELCRDISGKKER